jgi:splicing factor U2AF 65 kDa subunit
LYARDAREVDEEPASSRKRSRFDEVGELGRDSRETSDSRVRDTRDSRDSRERESRDRDRYRDDRDGRSRDYERHREPREDRHESRDDSRNDERSKRHRDDREHEKDREYDRYRRERSDKYRENNERNDRGYDRGNNSRVRYDRRYEGRVGGGGHGAIEIPFDRFLRLSPWRGPVTPLEERPRHLKNWDVAPAGFERISADKAKLTGLFPPPGNIAKTGNYVPPTLDPARAAMFQLLNRDTAGTSVNGNNNNSNVSNPSAELSGNLLKQAKRFYVGNLPFNFNETILVEFLETNLRGLSGGNGNGSGSNKNYDENRIILTINVSTDRSYAFVECRTAEDASLAMNLDGVVFEGTQLKVRRPKEYHVALTTGLLSSTSTAAGTNSTAMAATSTSPQLDNSIVNRRQLIISGIPDILTGDHVKSLLLLIADLRTFILLKDRESDESLGVAMFEFVEDFEGEEWSGPFLKHSKGSLFMGPFEMKIQRVCDLMESDENQSLRDLLSIYNLQPGFSTAPSSTPILQLLNIVTKEGLLLDYDSIYQDLNQELTKYSNSAIDLVIPKPADKTLIPGVGKVFVKFGTVEEAARAASELAGRIFDGHTCIVSFYPPEKFDKKLY